MARGIKRPVEADSRSRTYSSWHMMMQRCYNKTFNRYYCYGGKGISVCHRWHDYKNFLKDMGIRPDSKSLDRIDIDKNYNKQNCRWSDKYTQARNKSTSINITYYGVTKGLRQWCVDLLLPYKTIHRRYQLGKYKNSAELFCPYNLQVKSHRKAIC